MRLAVVFEGFLLVAFFWAVEIQFQAILHKTLFLGVCPMNSKWKMVQTLFTAMPWVAKKKKDMILSHLQILKKVLLAHLRQILLSLLQRDTLINNGNVEKNTSAH